MAESNVIGLVIAVVLFVMILLVGIGALNSVRDGIGGLWDTGDQQKEQLTAGSAAAACRNWLGSSNKYSAEAILKTYDIPGKMRAYASADCCWASTTQGLKRVSEDVLSACSRDPTSTDCNGGYVQLKAAGPLQNCLTACSTIIRIQDLVEQTCPQLTAQQKSRLVEKYSTIGGVRLCDGTISASVSVSCSD